MDFYLIWCVGRSRPDMRISVTSTRSKVKTKVTELTKLQKLHFSRSISCAVLACWSLIFEFPSRRTITRVQTSLNVDISWNSTGHILAVRDATVIWLGTLLVLHLLCMLMWPWPDPMSRSRAFELLKISEAVHAGGDDHQPPCGAFWLTVIVYWMN